MNEKIGTAIAPNTERTFHKKILIPRNSTPIIMLRYYAPPGGGLDDQWKTAIPPLNFTINGEDLEMLLYYSFNSQNKEAPDGINETAYIDGQREGGFEQHAQYYQNQVPILPEDTNLIISGTYPKVGYMSIVFYFNPGSGTMYQLQVNDFDLLCDTEGNGPYEPGNPSVFSDGNSLDEKYNFRKITKEPTSKPPIVSLNDFASREGELSLYRSDVNTSYTRYTDDIAFDGCSRSCLYAYANSEQTVLILRVKVPTTIVSSSTPDTIFGHYQCREISVNSNINQNDNPEPLLNFWGISSLMLNALKDENGYAYVFFAPTSYVSQLISESNPPVADYTPPVLTWGNFTGYVLGTPTHAMIIRYRGSSQDWIGNPENAQPYPSPVTSYMLGEYLPELFGDTFDNFINGDIGAVNKNQPWPSL